MLYITFIIKIDEKRKSFTKRTFFKIGIITVKIWEIVDINFFKNINISVNVIEMLFFKRIFSVLKLNNSVQCVEKSL